MSSNYIRTACIAASLTFAMMSSSFAADAVVASEANTGATVTVHMGQPLVVNLHGTNNSGEYWRLDADLTPELILSGRTMNTVAVAGAPDYTSFTFTTGAPGMIVFKASYLKAGVPVPGASSIVFNVNVLP